MTLREETVQHGFAADYVRYLIQFLVNKGFDKSTILAIAGIEAADLEKGDEWIYFSIDHNSFSKSIQDMNNNKLLGLEFGASISLKDHGYIGYAAGNTSTLGEAIDMMSKHFSTRTTTCSLTISDEGEFSILQVDSHA